MGSGIWVAHLPRHREDDQDRHEVMDAGERRERFEAGGHIAIGLFQIWARSALVNHLLMRPAEGWEGLEQSDLQSLSEKGQHAAPLQFAKDT